MRAILTYHAIDRTASVISVTPEVFRSHITWLAGESVAVVTIAELLELPEHVDAVALTFDDALSCIATEAAPLLAEHDFPATVFVVSDHAGGRNDWGGVTDARVPTHTILDWEALGRLAERGWTIGSHTRRHPHLTRCSEADLHAELAGSADTIHERLGVRPVTFAYPFGDCNGHVAEAAAQCYRYACTTEHQTIGTQTDPHRIPRLDAWYFRHPSAFRDWGSPQFRRAIAWRHALRRVRRVLR